MPTLLEMGREEEEEGGRSGERRPHIYCMYIKGRVGRKRLKDLSNNDICDNPESLSNIPYIQPHADLITLPPTSTATPQASR